MPTTVSHQLVVLQFLGVYAIFPVDDAPVLLHHSHQLGPLAVEVAAGMKTHIAKPLQLQLIINVL